jgi:hypothetical protein
VTAAPLAVHRSNGDRPGQAVPRPALRVVKPPSEFDLAAAEQAAAAFLVALGVDLDTEVWPLRLLGWPALTLRCSLHVRST